MTFTYTPNEGGQTILHVKALDDSEGLHGRDGRRRRRARGRRVVAAGAAAAVGTVPAFTGDSKWAAYFVTPAARGGRGAAVPRGGRGRGGADAGAGGRGAAEGDDQQRRSRISSC